MEGGFSVHVTSNSVQCWFEDKMNRNTAHSSIIPSLSVGMIKTILESEWSWQEANHSASSKVEIATQHSLRCRFWRAECNTGGIIWSKPSKKDGKSL